MAKKCIITMETQGQNYDAGIARMAALGVEAYWEKRGICSTNDPDVVIRYCNGYEIAIAGGERYDEKVFAACPALKLIVRFGAGYDRIDLEAAKKAGVSVCYLPGANAVAVAEHAVALMLCTLRRIPYIDANMRAGNYDDLYLARPQLSGKTVGLLGAGNIGKNVARMLSGFGCKILAYDVYRDEAFAKAYDVTYTDMETIFRQSDILSVHLPMCKETKWTVDADTIALMKPNAVIVNTSRGGLVHTEALAAALREGRILGAGLDVFEDESNSSELPGKAFLGLTNCVLTPHVASATFEAYALMMDRSVDAVEAYVKGLPIPARLN